MKKLNLLTLFFIVLVVISCISPREKLENKIIDLETAVYSDTTGIIDKSKVADLIGLYVDFADKYPGDVKTPGYLYSAANVSMNLMDSQNAISLFDRLMTAYPDYEKASECLFMKGFIYDNNLQDYEMAKKIYLEFLEKYPDDEFADDAQASIDNLGKSLEEIIQEFEKKNMTEEELAQISSDTV